MAEACQLHAVVRLTEDNQSSAPLEPQGHRCGIDRLGSEGQLEKGRPVCDKLDLQEVVAWCDVWKRETPKGVRHTNAWFSAWLSVSGSEGLGLQRNMRTRDWGSRG